jgi:hypothetical protein
MTDEFEGWMTADLMKLHGLRMCASRGRFMRASIASFASGWNVAAEGTLEG